MFYICSVDTVYIYTVYCLAVKFFDSLSLFYSFLGITGYFQFYEGLCAWKNYNQSVSPWKQAVGPLKPQYFWKLDGSDRNVRYAFFAPSLRSYTGYLWSSE